MAKPRTFTIPLLRKTPSEYPRGKTRAKEQKGKTKGQHASKQSRAYLVQQNANVIEDWFGNTSVSSLGRTPGDSPAYVSRIKSQKEKLPDSGLLATISESEDEEFAFDSDDDADASAASDGDSE